MGNRTETAGRSLKGNQMNQENPFEGLNGKMPYYPMTDSQLGVYLACSASPGETMYNIPLAFFMPGHLQVDRDRFVASVRKAVDSFPALMAVAGYRDDKPVMISGGSFPVEVPVVSVSPDALEEARQEFIRPFSLEEGPLFRFAILDTGDGFCFCMDIHHLVTDGSSVGIFLRQIALNYEGEEEIREETDVFTLAAYEEKFAGSPGYEASRTHFGSILSGTETDSNLLPDSGLSGRGENGPAGRLRIYYTPQNSSGRLEGFLREHGLKENALFLGAFSYCLAKFTGQEEALFCTANHGRFHSSLMNTVGMLVKTLPVHASICEDETAADFLGRLQQEFHRSLKLQGYPFGEMVRNFGIRPDILFVYQSSMLNSMELAGHRIPLEVLETGSSLSNLSLMVFRRDGEFELAFGYRKDLYRESTIRRFAAMMTRVLDAFCDNPLLKDIPLVSEGDVRLRQSFHDNRLDYDRNLTVVDLFRQQAARTPDHPAVVCDQRSLTYGELDRLSDLLAADLRKRGVRAETPVGILIGRSELFPVSFLGILKAGGAYQPLDPGYPPDRLQYMIKDSGMEILITGRDQEKIAGQFKGQLLYAEDIGSLAPEDTVRLESPSPEDMFVLLYTSGSTGVPKGCMLEHRNLMSFCRNVHQMYGISDRDRSIAYASFSFDATMMDFLPFLTKGATVYIVPEERRLDLAWLDDYFRKNRITNICLTTQLGRQYAVEYPDNPHIRAAVTGGEKLVSLEPPSYRLDNLYGPTECTVFVTGFTVDRKYNDIPIGRSVANTDIYMVDPRGREVPVGVPGELCIAGHQVGRGYLNREDLTGAVFVENPFSREPGFERMYRTGDICRFLEDGNIEFMGRRDHQVKIRGFRIELSEIEARIRQFAGIRDATVQAREAADGSKYVVAYVTGEKEISVQELNGFIMEELPHYMVPAVTMQIGEIPLNQNGKVDRRKLPEPVFAEPEPETASGRPLNWLEETLSEMAAGILGHDRIGVTTDLVRAGLTSLSGIRLATEIRKKFGYSPDVREILTGITILELENGILRHLLEQEKFPGGPDRSQGADPSVPWPLSSAQLGVWYEAMKRPGEILYNIPVMLSLPPEASPERLEEALEKVVRAHPYLLTRLILDGGEVRQIRPREAGIAVRRIRADEASLPDIRQDFPQPFDLLREPLFRFAIVETQSRVILLADFHHIIFDGTSLGIFLADLKKAYEGQTLEPETYSSLDALRDEQLKEGSASWLEAQEYYASRLKDYEGVTVIAPDRKGKPEEGSMGESVCLMDSGEILSCCQKHGITPAQLFLAGTAYTIGRFAGVSDTHFCSISSGRSDLRYSTSVGMFVRTLPLSIRIPEEGSAAGFLGAVRDIFLEALGREEYPFTQVAARHGFSPRIMYACQLGVMETGELPGGPETVLEELLPSRPKFDISVHIEDREGKIGVCVQYNDALYTPFLMDNFASSLGTAVRNMIHSPGDEIRRVSLISGPQEEVLRGFRGCPGEEPEEKLLHRLFSRQAALHPDRTALTAVDGSFSGRTLESRMNRMANGLRERGVRPGDLVALLLPRDSRLIVAMYGVLKAGGAYIPCDPEYPAERIRSILEDSGAAFVLTTEDKVGDFPAGKALCVDDPAGCPDDRDPRVPVDPQDLAYLIYTSGSTGKPKGVMLEHRGICNYVHNHPDNIHVRALVEDATAMVSVTTVSFDMSLKEIAVSLSNGVPLVLAGQEEARNPVQLAALFARTGADAFNATPSRLLEYLELPAFRDAMKRCRVIMAGGEAYPPRLLEKLSGLTEARLFNTYGPTEITVSSNGRELTGETAISVGRPLLNYREFIVDPDGNELPPGAPGELYIGGPGVARGYRNLPELTGERFISFKGERVYRSGDRARWNGSGEVEIAGRLDSQIKLRGLRIEPEEIEAVMARQKGLSQVVVTVRTLGGADQLCAYFTGNRDTDTEALREALGRELPDYMLPSVYVWLEALPVTPNGKTDLRSLPLPGPAKERKLAEPETRTERVICDIYARVLELPQVGATDSFFDLGGTSLVVTRVIIAAAAQGFEITYGDVFTHPTPRRLAAALEEGPGGKDLRDPSLENLGDYDYTDIRGVLKKNNLDTFLKGPAHQPGNILLTGATGFLGVHVLQEFLKTCTGTAYCLLRDKDTLSAARRLKSILYYYFEESYEELLGNRLVVLSGDITSPEALKNLKDLPVDTVINCAANVKHFSAGNDIEEVNVGGVLNLIDFCLATSARLVHVSTTSVSGFSIDGDPAPDTVMDEQMLYFGQHLDNKYGHSKFRAERFILENVSRGLKARIVRVGNLSARDSDGEFQINFTTNSFTGRLKSYLLIGKFPYSLINQPVEFSPIDTTAASILLLAGTPDGCSVFHSFNNHTVALGDIIRQMQKMGLPVEIAESREYEAALEMAEADPEKARILSSLIAYRNMGHGRQIRPVSRSNEYTLQVLSRLGFQWPITSREYMERFLQALQGLGYFDEA